MSDRFTDRARKVMMLTIRHAMRCGRESTDTEHLLLGLAEEDVGVAAYALKTLGASFAKLKSEVENLVPPVPPNNGFRTGKWPMTPRAEKVIEHALEEAEALGHRYVGTEHLLLGLVRDDGGTATQALKGLGLSPATVRAEVLSLLGHT